MKNKVLGILALIFIFSMLCVFMVSGGYFYLRRNIGASENLVSEVPYTFSEPEEEGILVECGGRQVFFYLNFNDSCLSIVFPPHLDQTAKEVYGYPINHTVRSDDSLLVEAIDELNGIELTQGGESLRYTGVQVTEMLSYMADTIEMEREILTALTQKIAQNGFDRQSFLELIENSETDLTVPECYFWSDYLIALCKNVNFVNSYEICKYA